MLTIHTVSRISFRRFRKFAMATMAMLIWLAAAPFALALDLLLGTGEVGSFSHHTGRMLCRIINKNVAGVTCSPVPAEDAVSTLTNLRGGSLDFAVVDSRMLNDAVRKTGRFAFLDITYENLRAVVPLYEMPAALVVRRDAGIASIDDLKGKRINAGSPGTLNRLAVETVMAAKGWKKKDFSLWGELPASQSQDTMAFCHGTIQAMVQCDVHPNAPLRRLLKLCEADLAAMDDPAVTSGLAGHPAFSPAAIPAGTYDSQPEAIQTFAALSLLVTTEEMDMETVTAVFRSLMDHRQRLQSAHPALFSAPPGGAWKKPAAIPLHQGAEAYGSGG